MISALSIHLSPIKTWNRVYKCWERLVLQHDVFRHCGNCITATALNHLFYDSPTICFVPIIQRMNSFCNNFSSLYIFSYNLENWRDVCFICSSITCFVSFLQNIFNNDSRCIVCCPYRPAHHNTVHYPYILEAECINFDRWFFLQFFLCWYMVTGDYVRFDLSHLDPPFQIGISYTNTW